MKEKRLVTCALAYVNNIPHVGHIVGSHLPADLFTRFSRSAGHEVLFVGGSDMHGTPALITARELNMDVEDMTIKLHHIHDNIYKKLGMSYDMFSHTHTPENKEITQNFFLRLLERGYIKEREMEMFFCNHCNIFLPDRFVKGTCPHCGFDGAAGDQCEKCDSLFGTNELKNAKCTICGGGAALKKTKHVFLDLGKDVKKLEKWIEGCKKVWRPYVYNEAKKWVSEGLRDRCISRDITWGFPVPMKGYENKVLYVWFDAPIGYISISREAGEDKYLWWKDKSVKVYNFIGKDNIQFHSIFFPEMIIEGDEYILPYNVVGQNFLNFEGQKISKSKKWGVFLGTYAEGKEEIDIDTFRAYLTTVIPENKDSDFRWEDFKNNTNSELVGKFGNLFNRTISMADKNFGGKLNYEITKDTALDQFDKDILQKIETVPEQIAELFDNAEFREAYKKIMGYAVFGNQYLEQKAPWQLIKQGNMDEVIKTLYICECLCASLCIVASPILPHKTKQAWTEQLNLKDDPTAPNMWKKASELIIKKDHVSLPPKPLFERVDDDRLKRLIEIFSEPYEFKNNG
ncbi:MAG: methionine--tRNA ligase [Christensenellaceae bacterium]|jgi:methionyl-tRNA synthetase|nr:methionine--tRNA ligase [Christensenellaceae bacterium]